MGVYDNHLRIRTVKHQLAAAGLEHGMVEAFISSHHGYQGIAVHIDPSADRDPYIEALAALPWTDKRIEADTNPYVTVHVPTICPAFLPVDGDQGDRITYTDVQPGDLIRIPDGVTPGSTRFDAVLRSWMPAQQVRQIEREGTGATAKWVITWAHNPEHDGPDVQYVSRIERHEEAFGARLVARLGRDFGAELVDEFARLDARA
jgi:hypothetical protein